MSASNGDSAGLRHFRVVTVGLQVDSFTLMAKDAGEAELKMRQGKAARDSEFSSDGVLPMAGFTFDRSDLSQKPPAPKDLVQEIMQAWAMFIKWRQMQIEKENVPLEGLGAPPKIQ